MKYHLKFGVVSEAKAGFAKIYFEEDNLVTDWLPILVRTSMKDKESWILNVNEHVACMVDTCCEEGVILGAIHSDPEPADSGAGPSKFRKVFEDGTYLEYDKENHTLTANVQGDVKITAAKTITANATIEADIESPVINLKGTVNVVGMLNAGGLAIAAAGGANGKVQGDINITGTVNADGDIQTGTISLKNHVHGGVSSGTSSTTPPTV